MDINGGESSGIEDGLALLAQVEAVLDREYHELAIPHPSLMPPLLEELKILPNVDLQAIDSNECFQNVQQTSTRSA